MALLNLDAPGRRGGLLALLCLLMGAGRAPAQPRWEAVTGGPREAAAIAFNARNARTVWFGASEDRLFVSHDGGRTARQAAQIPLGPRRDGRPTGTVVDLYVHPVDTLFMLAGSTAGVYLSRDGGASWAHALPATHVRQEGVAVAVDAGAPDNLAVGLAENQDAPGVHVYSSADRGLSWAPRSAPAFSAFATGGGGFRFGGGRTRGRLFLDVGDGWNVVHDVPDRADTLSVPRIAVDPRDRSFVWAALHGSGAPGLVVRSTNAGQTWRTVAIAAALNPWAIELDPQGRIFVGERGHGPPGVYLSLDEGNAWQHVPVTGAAPGATAATRMVRTGPAGVFLSDDRHGVFRMVDVPPVPPRPAKVYAVESTLPPLTGGRIRARRTPAGAASDLIVTGLQSSGRPFAGVFAVTGEAVRTTATADGLDTAAYVTTFSGINLPLGHWNGDVLFEDLSADGRADVLLSGNTAPDSLPAVPQTLLYLDASGAATRVGTPLPDLYASRLAAQGALLALAGRRAGGDLVLEVYELTRAAVPGFRRVATLPGLELPALALGDCDGDGDADLFAAGADAAGLPVARLYRNTGGLFAEAAVLPGLFLGEAAFGDLDGDGTADLAHSGYRYGPALAEGAVYAYRMAGCTPTPLAVPAPLRTMMADVVALEDFDDDGDLDLITAGLDAPFSTRNGVFRVARNDGHGGFSLSVEQPAAGIGAGSFTRTGVGPRRAAVVGTGLDDAAQPRLWFYTRPARGAGN